MERQMIYILRCKLRLPHVGFLYLNITHRQAYRMNAPLFSCVQHLEWQDYYNGNRTSSQPEITAYVEIPSHISLNT